MKEPFFIGWDASSAPSTVARMRRTGWALLVVGLLVAAVVAGVQRTPGSGTFAFGQVESYRGVLLAEPTPLLVVDEPIGGHRILYLVNPLKQGFDAERAAAHHLREVALKGTLIRDERDGMIEVTADAIQAVGEAGAAPEAEVLLGMVTLRGEIVDSKCHLGVMNPGRFKPHRACAIQCVKGGIPPILVTAMEGEGVAHFLLVGASGEPVNAAVLDFIAEPIEVSGLLSQLGDLRILRMDPESLRRL